MNSENPINRDIQIIAEFILELRGQGHFLPYADYEIISGWTKLTPNPDALILILAEILPPFFEKAKGNKNLPPSLSGVNRKIISQLKSLKPSTL